MKGLILAGGHGTRLRPLTYSRQKQLLPVADKDIIFYLIEDLVSCGIRDIGIVIGPNKEQVQSEIGDGSRWGIKINYIFQNEPKGLAHAVMISQEFIQDSEFIMCLGDNIFSHSIKEFIDSFTNSEAEASILLTHVKHPEQFGLAYLNEDQTINKLVEKPEHPESDLGIVGVYAFKNSIFEVINNMQPSARGELEITDAIQQLIDQGKKVSHGFVKGWWEDTGNPASLLEANKLVLDKIDMKNEGTVEEGATIEGKVGIGQGTIIKSGSKIIGPCIIGENCEIKGNINPYTSIGNNVKIYDADIKYSIVLHNAEISTSKKIRNSIIGEGCKLTHNQEDKCELIIGDNSSLNM